MEYNMGFARRRFICSTVMLSMTAGCSFQADTILTDLDILNLTDSTRTVAVRFRRDGETLFNETYTIEPDMLDGELDLDAGTEFTVEAEVDDEIATLRYRADPECSDNEITVAIEDGGRVTLYQGC